MGDRTCHLEPLEREVYPLHDTILVNTLLFFDSTPFAAMEQADRLDAYSSN
jgi:hypothetical protein